MIPRSRRIQKQEQIKNGEISFHLHLAAFSWRCLLVRNCIAQFSQIKTCDEHWFNLHFPVTVSTPKTYTKPEQSPFAVSGDISDSVIILAFGAT